MATVTAIKTVPFTKIDTSVIKALPQIGVHGFAVYAVLKSHLNQKSGQCNPSYATIAHEAGIDRSTVIRSVTKLKALKLLSLSVRFKEDGSPSSNQYAFSGTHKEGPSENSEKSIQCRGTGIPVPFGSGPEPPPIVADDTPPSSTEPPKQSFSLNKKNGTKDIAAALSEKQKTCPHPPSEIVFLADNITLCHHCYGLLDENLRLQEENTPPAENVWAA